MNKANFSAKALKEFRTLVNREHKSLSSCLRTIRDNWAMVESLAEADGLGLEDVTPKYIVNHLHNDNYNRAGVLGRLVKVEGSDEKEFRAWETWTPARALDYLRRASACHFRELCKK